MKSIFQSFKKKTIQILVFGLSTFHTFAQSSAGNRINQGFDAATNTAKSWVGPLTNFLWALAALVGTAGLYKVYQKYQSGDQDAMKSVLVWGGGFIVIVIGNVFIKAVFEV